MDTHHVGYEDISMSDRSPSSSPALGTVDSSPLSSPIPDFAELDPASPIEGPPHPWAASMKSMRPLSQRQKQPNDAPGPPVTPARNAASGSGSSRHDIYSRSLQEDAFKDPFETSPGSDHRTSRYLDHEERVWEEALRIPFDTGRGYIDLSDKQLKSIPPSIADLSGFFSTADGSEQVMMPTNRVLSRVKTEPAFEPSRTRAFQRTNSIVDSGKDRHLIQLYLARNSITVLPTELFSVDKLTVLSLRANRLTHIPADICRLSNLRELNVSLNRLTYLPAEMRNMHLEALMVFPNPFRGEPCSDSIPTSRAQVLIRRRSITRLHAQRKETASSAPTKPPPDPLQEIFLPPVPPLSELCLRRLISPAYEPALLKDRRTVLSETYGLPVLDAWDELIPAHLRATLNACIPGALKRAPPLLSTSEAVTRARTAVTAGDGEPITGIGRCANPAHAGQVFVRHACQRFTWESRVAGVDVGSKVPLKWRGCLQRCLQFLDVNELEASNLTAQLRAPAMVLATVSAPQAAPPAEDTLDSDEDMDFETVGRSAAPLTFED